MNRKLLTLILFLLLAPMAEAKQVPKTKINEKAPETVFLRKVESAVRTHDADLLLTYMLPDYKRTQHDEFLAGNTVQFLNDFFCSVIFNDISFIGLLNYSLMEKSKTEYEVAFEINTWDEGNGNIILTHCTVYMHKDPVTKVFSIYSAVG